MQPGSADQAAPPFTREWVTEWIAVGLRLPVQRDPIEPVQMRRVAAEVARRLGNLESKIPPIYELDETVRILAAAWEASRALHDVAPRQLRRAPWAFFHPKDRPDRWLGRDGALVRAWLRWLADQGRGGTVIAMLRAFLNAYPTELPLFDELRQAIDRQLRAIESPRTTRWRERCDRFGLLDRAGPDQLVQSWFRAESDCDSFLSEAGLSGLLESSGFVRRASERLLSAIESDLRSGRGSEARVGRAFDWLERDAQLRLPELKVDVANAFLRPFVQKAPTDAIKDKIQSFLCRTVGDPRIKRGHWYGVADEIKQVLLRWLVGASLDDFFRVLDRTALDRHWRHRKTFWTAYLKQKAIDDAWVVFGPEAARIVHGGFNAGVAQLVRGYGVLANHSVLLMRIRGVTIAEWSHNGSCRMWKRGNKQAPKLYEAEYTRSELTEGCDVRQTHHGAEKGNWQGSVADFIERETGLRSWRRW